MPFIIGWVTLYVDEYTFHWLTPPSWGNGIGITWRITPELSALLTHFSSIEELVNIRGYTWPTPDCDDKATARYYIEEKVFCAKQPVSKLYDYQAYGRDLDLSERLSQPIMGFWNRLLNLSRTLQDFSIFYVGAQSATPIFLWKGPITWRKYEVIPVSVCGKGTFYQWFDSFP